MAADDISVTDNQKDGYAELRRSESPVVVEFSELAQGATEVIVRHMGQDYRLRLTRNGKLILNK